MNKWRVVFRWGEIMSGISIRVFFHSLQGEKKPGHQTFSKSQHQTLLTVAVVHGCLCWFFDFEKINGWKICWTGLEFCFPLLATSENIMEMSPDILKMKTSSNSVQNCYQFKQIAFEQNKKILGNFRFIYLYSALVYIWPTLALLIRYPWNNLRNI